MRYRHLLRRHAPALLGLPLPALVWLAPMLRDPFHTVVGMEGDNLYYVRHFWWMAHALAELHRSPFFDPSSYFPAGYALSGGEMTPANTILAVPITLVLGPVAAYNVMVLASFVLTGWATYAWVYRLTGSRAGALVAGVIAEMAPYRLAHASGHLPLIATQGFPLALWTFEECLASRSRRWAVALGLSVALLALSSWYYAYSIAIVLPIYAVLRTRSAPGLWRTRSWWVAIATSIGVAAVLVIPFAAPYVRAAQAGGMRKSFYEMLAWSLNFYDFIIPNVGHPWWAATMKIAFPRESDQWAERSVSLGYIAIALAIVGLVRRRTVPRWIVAPLVAAGVVSALVALGPFLHSGDRQVLIPMPYIVTKTVDWVFARVRPYSLMRNHLWTQQVLAIPLPSVLLFLIVPATAGMRVMARFGYWTLLMTSALAAIGVRSLLAGPPRTTSTNDAPRPYAVAMIALVLCGVVFESWSQKVVTSWTPRAVDRWVATQSPGEVVVELPLSEALRPAQDYYVTVQQHPTVFGPIGDTFQPLILLDRMRALTDFPSAASLDALRSWGATLILVNTARAPNWPALQSGLAQSPHVDVVTEIEGVVVYRLRRQGQ